MSKFPLVNARINIQGDWTLQYKSETFIVPSSGIYRLDEIPDNGSIESKPIISGLTLTSTYPPDTNQFYVNYYLGKIAFHSSKIGSTYTCNYYGKGSSIDVEDINNLYDRIIALESA